MVVHPIVAAFPLMLIVTVTAIKDAIEDYRRWSSDLQLNHRMCYSLPLSHWRNWNYADVELLSFSQRIERWFKMRIKKPAARAARFVYGRLRQFIWNASSSISITSTSAHTDPDALSINGLSGIPAVLVSGLGGMEWQPVQWKNVRVGDLVFLQNDDPVPADMIVLNTSEPDCICYVETKNLDGETNLKLKQGPPELYWLQTADDCAHKLKITVESEPPNTNMLKYQAALSFSFDLVKDMLAGVGKLANSPSQASLLLNSTVHSDASSHSTVSKRMLVDINGLVMRGSVIRNTKWMVGVVVFTGDDTKQVMNFGKTPSKRTNIDILMNKHVAVNLIFVVILCLIVSIAYPVWFVKQQASNAPYAVNLGFRDPGTEGFFAFWASLIFFQNIVPISLYISIEIVKIAHAYFIHEDLDMYYEEKDTPCNPRSWNLSDDLGQVEYIFSDKTGTLTRNIMQFKKCSIGGKVYDGSGKRSVSSLNIDSPRTATYKTNYSFKSQWLDANSKREARLKSLTVATPTPLESIQEQGSIVSASGDHRKRSLPNFKSHRPNFSTSSHPNPRSSDNDVIPRTATEPTNMLSSARHLPPIDTSGLSYPPSEAASIAPDLDEEVLLDGEATRGFEDEALMEMIEDPALSASPYGATVKDFFILLSVCHTVLVDEAQKSTDQATTDQADISKEDPEHDKQPNNKVIAYKAQSPDEACLVTLAAETGFIFRGREHNSSTSENDILVEILGEESRYALLNVLEFDSDRKRMSVIVRPTADNPNNDVIVFCKGADSVIFERLAPNQEQLRESTFKQLEKFAQSGLRTLCLAKRTVSADQYRDWTVRYHEASTRVYADQASRASTLEFLNNEMETGLILLGATAIEDRLQDGVPECIKSLSQAGIKIWVLTGDKIETAINVGFLCGLLKNTDPFAPDLSQENLAPLNSDEMVLIQVKSASSEQEASALLQKVLSRFFRNNTNNYSLGRRYSLRGPEYALIIDGLSLKYILDNTESRNILLEIGCQCKAVICCRVSPLQKAKVVELVKSGKNCLTLAIGDGANDVSMIQAADIGVGISGEEGLQAAMSADYSIAQFRFLHKLLLVHGRWCYTRVAFTILNFYLKSTVFTIILFWFQFFAGFSGAIIYEFSYMLFYNLVFTNLPILFYGMFDQFLPDSILRVVPQIYGTEGIKQIYYSHQKFAIYFAESIWHSLVCFFIPVWFYWEAVNPSGYVISMVHLGTVMAVSAIMTVNLSVALDLHAWNYITHIGVWLSEFSILIYILFYSFIPNTPILGMTGDLFPDLNFWCTIIFCILISLAPRFLYYYATRVYKPTDSQILEEIAYLIRIGRSSLKKFLSESQLAVRMDSIISMVGATGKPREPSVQMVPLSRRPSISSIKSVTYDMNTGKKSKISGFSFSSPAGMANILLRNPFQAISSTLQTMQTSSASLGRQIKSGITSSLSRRIARPRSPKPSAIDVISEDPNSPAAAAATSLSPARRHKKRSSSTSNLPSHFFASSSHASSSSKPAGNDSLNHSYPAPTMKPKESADSKKPSLPNSEPSNQL